jgi:hypothetical protein
MELLDLQDRQVPPESWEQLAQLVTREVQDRSAQQDLMEQLEKQERPVHVVRPEILVTLV